MKLWLTKQNNGLYTLSLFRPQKEVTHKEDVIIIPGEPGIRNICSEILKVISVERELKDGDFVKVELKGKLIKDGERD